MRGELSLGMPQPAGMAAVEWRVSDKPVSYEDALAVMEVRAEAIAKGDAPELVWLIEHPPLYTAGTSANPADVLDARFPVHESGRGGQMTYHGPGQRVGYVMIDLRRFVATLEEWIIRTLAPFNVRGERREDRIGVWVKRPDKGDGFEDKIAALGIRVKKWVTLHGIAINVEPDLSHFDGIVPCGVSVKRYGVTSLVDLGIPAAMTDVDVALRAAFEELFGAAQNVGSTENSSPGTRALKSASEPAR